MNRAGLLVVVAALLLAVVTSWAPAEALVQAQLDGTEGVTIALPSGF